MEIDTICPMCGTHVRVTPYASTTIGYAECPICHSIINATVDTSSLYTHEYKFKEEVLQHAEEYV